MIQTVTWTRIRTEADLPLEGGTYAVSYGGDTSWLYFNVDTKTWHPARGWRARLGQPWNSVKAWCALPKYSPFLR